MIIRNPGRAAIPLPNGGSIPAGGEVAIPDDEWLAVSGDRFVAAWVAAGTLRVAPEPPRRAPGSWRNRKTEDEAPVEALQAPEGDAGE